MSPECPGHPAGPYDPMGETTYCDGSCQPKSPEPGCYLDSHHGFMYNSRGIIFLAANLGRPLSDKLRERLSGSHFPDLSDRTFETMVEESDRSIEWLNENCPLEGHTWDWSDGDFGLYADEEEE